MARGKKKESALTPEEKLAQALLPDWERPYKVPDNWCWTRLMHVAKWGSGGTPSRRNPAYYEGCIPWIKTGELNDDYIYETEEHISDEAIANSSAKIFPINTVAIAMYGATIGKVGILGVEATTNQACACAVSSSALDYKYLFRYAQLQKDAFIKKSKGGAQPNISQEIIKEHEIPLPPLAEQQRIVDRIEYLFAKLDEGKEKAQSVLDSFETRKAAILHKAFTGELTAKWRAEHGVGMEGWRNTQIGNESHLITKGASPRWQGVTYTDDRSQTLFVTSENVREGYLDLSKEKYLDNKINEIQKRSVLQKGDVLVNIVGASIGRSAIFDLDCLANTNQAVCIIRQKETVFNRFLCYFLNSPDALSYYSENKVETARANISLADINNMAILLPTMDEQTEIVRILDSLFAKEQQAKEAAEAVLEKIDLLKKSILARAFRGELGTNNPTEESALELLKNILAIPTEPKTPIKRTFIPKDLENQIKTELERKIIKLYIQGDTDVIPTSQMMSVSSKKFEIMDTLRSLQQRGILAKENDAYRILR